MEILRCLLILGALLTAVLNGSDALSYYRNGRFVGGFLGAPSKVTPVLRGDAEPEDLWFEQRLDNFDASNTTYWRQRFFVNAAHYRNDSSAPIFLMIGGEAEASKRWMNEGAWIHYAEHFGALCFQVEHRYYGKSHPTGDLSVENLRWLTSEQALADLAAFIRAMRQLYNLADTQRWIAFGGSYPGSLAAWLRELHPELVHGAISSSGPLLAKVDFREYFDVVTASLASYNPACVTAVQRAFNQVETLTKHMIGQRFIDEHFNTCTPIKDSIASVLDMASFYESLASNFAGVVQYNKDNSPHATITIDDVCDVLLNTTLGTPVTRLALVNGLLLVQSNETCLDYKYDKMIAEMRETAWDAKVASGMRQWTYQTCNEFGFYQTSEADDTTFGARFDVDFFIRQCGDIYSESMNREYLQQVVAQTNQVYGALKPNTTNVLYVHGSIDPWHALGLTNAKSPQTPTIYIEGTAHCANMYEPIKADPPALVEARNKITKYLAQLLQRYKHTRT